MKIVNDITPESVVHLARQMWRRSGMGTPVTSMPQFIADLMMDSTVSHTEMLRVLGWLVSESYGADTPVSKGTKAKYKRIIRRHGVPALHPECSDDGWPLHARLDLDLGEEVLHAAL
jgi:hypothetical protein